MARGLRLTSAQSEASMENGRFSTIPGAAVVFSGIHGPRGSEGPGQAQKNLGVVMVAVVLRAGQNWPVHMPI